MCDAPVVKESLVKTELEEQKMETNSSDTMAKVCSYGVHISVFETCNSGNS